MAEVVETTGKTVEEAIEKALKMLGATADEVTSEVLAQPSKGLFGLWSKPAFVRVSRKVPVKKEKTDLDTAIDAAVDAAVDAAFDKSIDTAIDAAVDTAVDAAVDAVFDGGDASKATKTAADVSEPKEAESPEAAAKRKAGEEKALQMGETFLRELLTAMNLPVKLTRQPVADGVQFGLEGADLGVLIGKHGQTLDSLQYLVNLAANRDRSLPHVHIILDVESYRSRREETLSRLAGHLADKACRMGEDVHLEPMNRHERKVIHKALQSDRRVATFSLGEEPRRYVVISPQQRRRKTRRRRSEKPVEKVNKE